jgi:hypothetical protein
VDGLSRLNFPLDKREVRTHRIIEERRKGTSGQGERDALPGVVWMGLVDKGSTLNSKAPVNDIEPFLRTKFASQSHILLLKFPQYKI